MGTRFTLSVLLALTVLAYAPVRTAGFVYEDAHWIEGLQLQAAHPAPEHGRNLAFVSWTVTNAAVGTSPLWWHVGNVVGHLVNGVLVYALLTVLLPAGALFGAGLFLLHPINSETVAYVAERTEIVSTALVLGAVLLGVRRVTLLRTLGAIVLIYLAMLAKASAVVGVVLVPLIWTRRGWPKTSIWTDAFAVGTWIGLAGVIGYAALITLADPYTRANPHGPLLFAARQAAALWRYLGLVVWPVGFSVDHDIEAVPAWLAGVALAGTGALAGWAYQSRRRDAGLAVAWILLALAPRFLIRLPEYLNEHQLYLASVGVALLAAGSYARVEARWRS